MNADDRLSIDPLGRVEGGNRIVEGSHRAPVSLSSHFSSMHAQGQYSGAA